jgi:hypothetical protein
MRSMSAAAATASTTEIRTVAVLSPKMEPKRTRTPAVPLPALLLVVKIVRKRTPSPSVHAKSEPITTSPARAARSPRAPIDQATGDRRHSAETDVRADDGGGESAGEGDVAERVAWEHLRAQHDEPAGKLEPFEDAALERAIQAVERGTGFDVATHDVVLRGACADCRGG